MPLADPKRSLKVAGRHLFRHLGDANALRRNPLVCEFFRQGSGTTSAAVLTEIREVILREARGLRHEDMAAGLVSRADRHYEVIAGLCAGEPAVVTAARIGLSRRQYYRERQASCLRISAALARGPSTSA